MKPWLLFAFSFTLFAGAAQLSAQANPDDAEGCKDSLLVSRYPGGKINSCENKEFEQADLPIGSDNQMRHVEGEYHYWDIATHEGVSDIQVFRNFEAALRQAHFDIVYTYSPNLITARKGNTWIGIESKGTYYYQTIVTEQEMKQEVTADSSSLKDEIEKTGHVAVYGILFDTGKATLQPASDGPLNEVLKLLTEDASLKLQIEGHTDNVGAAAANQALSEKRAQAVKDWLVAHGIAADRLTSKGFGATKPVADNSTDQGKAQNRRVELVKQ